MAGPSDSKTEKVAEIIGKVYPREIKRILVVGCGDGSEAAVLARALAADVVGIDIKSEFNCDAAEIADLRAGDAENLEFDDATFDFVYSYHALEHIGKPEKALGEMHRVLKPAGGVWIGTPNRSRLLGYVGSADATLGQKMRWNIADWRARLAGRFRNELGAHAGFTSGELRTLLSPIFVDVSDVSDTYFLAVYARFERPLTSAIKFRVNRFIYPGVYFTALRSRE